MKKTMLMTGLAVLAFMPVAYGAEETPVSETTKVIVEPGKTEVVTEGKTTVVVEEETKLRDAITGEPVDEKTDEEKEDMSLRDKVRGKME